jgi:hypothetical protein
MPKVGTRFFDALLRHQLQGQLRIRDVDSVAAEKLDDCERTVGDEDKLLVLHHKFGGFRDPLYFPIIDVALADVSRCTQMFGVVHAVWLDAWELGCIHGQAPAVTNEEGKIADTLQRLELTYLVVDLEHIEGSMCFHDEQHM